MPRSLTSALLAAAVLPFSPALAADLDPPVYAGEAPEYVPVEVGSGWYLRGDVGYGVEDAYGSGRDLDRDYRAGGFDLDDSENRFTGSLGIGYHFTDYFRSDVNVGYVAGNDGSVRYADGDDRASGDLKNDAWYAMANVYADLGTIADFTPYVGAGAGVLSNKGRWDARYDFDGREPYGRDAENRDYAFAYALNAGLAYRVTGNLSLDLGYQYIASPDAEYVDVTDPEDFRVRDDLDFHQVRIGLRYDLW